MTKNESNSDLRHDEQTALMRVEIFVIRLIGNPSKQHHPCRRTLGEESKVKHSIDTNVECSVNEGEES